MLMFFKKPNSGYILQRHSIGFRIGQRTMSHKEADHASMNPAIEYEPHIRRAFQETSVDPPDILYRLLPTVVGGVPTTFTIAAIEEGAPIVWGDSPAVHTKMQRAMCGHGLRGASTLGRVIWTWCLVYFAEKLVKRASTTETTVVEALTSILHRLEGMAVAHGGLKTHPIRPLPTDPLRPLLTLMACLSGNAACPYIHTPQPSQSADVAACLRAVGDTIASRFGMYYMIHELTASTGKTPSIERMVVQLAERLAEAVLFVPEWHDSRGAHPVEWEAYTSACADMTRRSNHVGYGLSHLQECPTSSARKACAIVQTLPASDVGEALESQLMNDGHIARLVSYETSLIEPTRFFLTLVSVYAHMEALNLPKHIMDVRQFAFVFTGLYLHPGLFSEQTAYRAHKMVLNPSMRDRFAQMRKSWGTIMNEYGTQYPTSDQKAFNTPSCVIAVRSRQIIGGICVFPRSKTEPVHLATVMLMQSIFSMPALWAAKQVKRSMDHLQEAHSVELNSINDLLIEKITELAQQGEYRYILVFPFAAQAAILRKKYGFIDVSADVCERKGHVWNIKWGALRRKFPRFELGEHLAKTFNNMHNDYCLVKEITPRQQNNSHGRTPRELPHIQTVKARNAGAGGAGAGAQTPRNSHPNTTHKRKSQDTGPNVKTKHQRHTGSVAYPHHDPSKLPAGAYAVKGQRLFVPSYDGKSWRLHGMYDR